MENKKPILIIGAGGFGREVFWLISEINLHKPEWDVLGFLDDDKHALDGFENYPAIVGSINDYNGGAYLINAIGKPGLRKKTVIDLNKTGVKWATLIHPTSSIGINSTIGEGSILARNSVVSCDAKLGCHVHVNMYSSCDHDAILGDFCTLALNVDIQGGVQVGEGVFFGGNAVILAGSTVGEWSTIGALTVVLREVKPLTTVAGVPAKNIEVRI